MAKTPTAAAISTAYLEYAAQHQLPTQIVEIKTDPPQIIVRSGSGDAAVSWEADPETGDITFGNVMPLDFGVAAAAGGEKNVLFSVLNRAGVRVNGDADLDGSFRRLAQSVRWVASGPDSPMPNPALAAAAPAATVDAAAAVALAAAVDERTVRVDRGVFSDMQSAQARAADEQAREAYLSAKVGDGTIAMSQRDGYASMWSRFGPDEVRKVVDAMPSGTVSVVQRAHDRQTAVAASAAGGSDIDQLVEASRRSMNPHYLRAAQMVVAQGFVPSSPRGTSEAMPVRGQGSSDRLVAHGPTGPLPLITVAEARVLVSALGQDDDARVRAIVTRLLAAVDADPLWREPLR